MEGYLGLRKRDNNEQSNRPSLIDNDETPAITRNYVFLKHWTVLCSCYISDSFADDLLVLPLDHGRLLKKANLGENIYVHASSEKIEVLL